MLKYVDLLVTLFVVENIKFDTSLPRCELSKSRWEQQLYFAIKFFLLQSPLC